MPIGNNLLTRVINQLQEAKIKKKYSVMVIMGFASCFEKCGGLLYKAMNTGIDGGLLLFLHNYLNDIKHKLLVNDGESQWITSKVGIPQGSVLSLLLCNLYTPVTL